MSKSISYNKIQDNKDRESIINDFDYLLNKFDNDNYVKTPIINTNNFNAKLKTLKKLINNDYKYHLNTYDDSGGMDLLVFEKDTANGMDTKYFLISTQVFEKVKQEINFKGFWDRINDEDESTPKKSDDLER